MPPGRFDFELFPEHYGARISGDAVLSCFRVPLLVAVSDGQKQRLLAFTEARLPSLANGLCEDTAPSRLAVRHSSDGGLSWGHILYLTPAPAGNETQPVVNLGSATVHGASGTLFVHYVSGYHAGGTPKVLYKKSTDFGENWLPPVDITASVPPLFVPGPGNGVELSDDRLVICGRTLTGLATPRASASAVCILSDDAGGTWRTGKPVPVPASSSMRPGENEAVALPSGSELLLSLRDEQTPSSGRRLQARSQDGGQTWGTAQPVDAFHDPGCEGSLARVDASRLALSSDHDATKRANLSVAVSSDAGASWTPFMADVGLGNVTEYSAMAMASPGRMAVLYETRRPSETKLTVHFVSFAMK